MTREIDGVKIIVTPEQYKKVQKSLEEQLIEKDKEIERLNKTNNEIFKANEILAEEIERLNNIIDKKEQFLGDNIKRLEREVVKRDNIINKIEEHFVFLKMNSTGGNKEFFEDILDFIKVLKELKGSDKE